MLCYRKKRKAKDGDKKDADEQGLVDGEEDLDVNDDELNKVTTFNFNFPAGKKTLAFPTLNKKIHFCYLNC